MSVTIELPHVGESVVEGTIGKWLKQPGDTVKRYEPLVEIITDKVTMEVPSPVEGSLVRVLAQEGETCPWERPSPRSATADSPEGAEPVTAPIQLESEPAALSRCATYFRAPRAICLKDVTPGGPTRAARPSRTPSLSLVRPRVPRQRLRRLPATNRSGWPVRSDPPLPGGAAPGRNTFFGRVSDPGHRTGWTHHPGRRSPVCGKRRDCGFDLGPGPGPPGFPLVKSRVNPRPTAKRYTFR